MFYCVVTLFAGIKSRVIMATMDIITLIHRLRARRYLIVFLIE